MLSISAIHFNQISVLWGFEHYLKSASTEYFYMANTTTYSTLSFLWFHVLHRLCITEKPQHKMNPSWGLLTRFHQVVLKFACANSCVNLLFITAPQIHSQILSNALQSWKITKDKRSKRSLWGIPQNKKYTCDEYYHGNWISLSLQAYKHLGQFHDS